MNFYTDRFYTFIYYTLFLTTSINFYASHQNVDPLRINQLSSLDQKKMQAWHEKQAPCPLNSPVNPTLTPAKTISPSQLNRAAASLRLTQTRRLFRSRILNSLRTKQIVTSTMVTTVQSGSSIDNASLARVPSMPILIRCTNAPILNSPQEKIQATLDELNKSKKILKDRSDNFLMQKYAATAVGVLLAGATYYVATAYVATPPAKRVFGIDDAIGASIAKEIIKPICCAIFGGVIWYNAYNFFYGTILERMKQQDKKVEDFQARITCLQYEINGFKPQLATIQTTVSKMENVQEQGDAKLNQIIPQVAIACKDAAKARESMEQVATACNDALQAKELIKEAENRQSLQSELDTVLSDALQATSQINDLHEAAQTLFLKNKEKKKSSLFHLNLFGITKK